ncbi:hypothetical protein GJ496_004872 [Pomphorhynchus laevis]|nr:hypothetical protein GJ496_004872 [Pomphorhynchus laevis]
MSRYSRPRGTSLFVRNLSDHVRAEDLREMFGRFGRLKDVYLPPDYFTGKPRGFAYFEEPRDADIALRELDRVRLFGRELEVDFARGDRKAPNEMRKRERGSRHGDFGRMSSPYSSIDRHHGRYERNDRRLHRGRVSRSISRDRVITSRRSRSISLRYRSRSRSRPTSPFPYEDGSTRYAYRNY